MIFFSEVKMKNCIRKVSALALVGIMILCPAFQSFAGLDLPTETETETEGRMAVYEPAEAEEAELPGVTGQEALENVPKESTPIIPCSMEN